MPRFAVILFLGACYVAVIAYDFKSLDYNQYLASELDYYKEHDELPIPKLRFRRDEEAAITTEKCRNRRKRLCCAEDSVEIVHEKDREIKRECFKHVLGKELKEPRDPFRCENMEKHKRDMTCVMQCVAQKNNILDADGKIQEAALAKFVKESFAKDQWFSEHQDEVIRTCINYAKNATVNGDKKTPDACNPSGIRLSHCLFEQIQMKCPETEIKDPKSCAKLRERIKSKIAGSDSVPPPPSFLPEE